MTFIGKNYDSSIGERHHVSLIKKPAQRTQRRREVFEMQTEKRYCEKIAIRKATSELNCCSKNVNETALYTNKIENTTKKR